MTWLCATSIQPSHRSFGAYATDRSRDEEQNSVSTDSRVNQDESIDTKNIVNHRRSSVLLGLHEVAEYQNGGRSHHAPYPFAGLVLALHASIAR